MDIINSLQAYLAELDNLSNQMGRIGNYREASRVSNLGQKVIDLIDNINEFENSPIEEMVIQK